MFESHNRFVAGTTLFHDFLISLGFELKETNTKDVGATKRRPIKTFELKNKVIVDAYDWLQLTTDIKGKPRTEYRGYTVSKDLVIFFSQRQLEEVKNENDL